MHRIKQGVQLFILICIPLMWLFAEHQRNCFTISMYITLLWFTFSLNVYSSVMRLWRASKKGSQYLLECIFFCCDSIQSIKVPPLLLYAEHQRSSCTMYLNVYYYAVIICITLKKLLHCFYAYSYYGFIHVYQGVTLFVLMYFTLLWFYAEHQICCCTI